LLVHEAAHDGQRCLVADGTPAARVGTRRDLPGGAAPPKQFLDERLAHPKEGCEGTLRAEPLIIGAENLLPKVKRVGFHAHKHKG
jgi:imidazolonepropionase-like amidohydrolase